MRKLERSTWGVCLVLAQAMAACGGGDPSGASPDGGSAPARGPDGGPRAGDGGSALLGADASTSPPGADGGGAPSVDGGAPGSGACGAYGAGVFSAPNPWTEDVSCVTAAAESKAMMNALVAAGGWGTGATRLQIDTSLVVLHADDATPMVPIARTSDYTTPDCDDITSVPLPLVGAIEGNTGYSCDAANEDCHLLVVHEPTHKLYELYQSTMSGGSLQTSCAVVWDLSRAYGPVLRGDQCTSADAAGFPLAAMLPDADEVASGEIKHAIRFALPNARMRAKTYVHPATHAGGPSGNDALPPYGVRLRLRADYPLASLPSDGARVIARALQRYGMFLADGGNVPLMVQSDQFTTHKWSDPGIDVDSHALYGIAPTDFDVVQLGTPVKLTYDCVRTP